MHSEDAGRSHKPRNAGGFQKMRKARNRLSPRASRRNQPCPQLDCRLLPSPQTDQLFPHLSPTTKTALRLRERREMSGREAFWDLWFLRALLPANLQDPGLHVTGGCAQRGRSMGRSWPRPLYCSLGGVVLTTITVNEGVAIKGLHGP